MTTILIKKKDTAGAPAAGDLTNAAGGAEIAVNTATKRIYSKDSGGTVIEMGTFPSTMAVQGALSAIGNVTLGDAAADNVTVNGTITSNLIFTDATYDIGASGANRPRDLFLSRNLTVGGTLTLAGGVNLNGNVTVGDSSADTLTINSTITSNLIFTDNTYDIGASGATRPRSLFLGTNLTAGGLGAFGSNVGIGVAPTAWTGAYALSVGTLANFGQRTGGNADLVMSWNGKWSGGSSGAGYTYLATGDVVSSYEQNGSHRWYTLPTTGTAGGVAAVSLRMAISAAGYTYINYQGSALANLNILTAGAGGGIQLIRNNGSNPTTGQSFGQYAWKGTDSANTNNASEAMIDAVAAENHTGSSAATNMLFYTKNTGVGPGSAPSLNGVVNYLGQWIFGGNTQSPDSNAKLTLYTSSTAVGLTIYEQSTGNNARLRLSQTAGAVVYDATYSSGSNSHVFQIGSGTAATISSAGNLSVGTTAQEGRLTVAYGNEATGQVQIAQFRTEATGSTTYNAGVQIYGTASATAGNRSVVLVLDPDGANAAGGDYTILDKLGNNGDSRLYNGSNASLYLGTNATNTIRLFGANTLQIQGRSSTAYGNAANVQEWAGTVGSIANGASFSLFAINGQYDMLCYDLNIFANTGGFFSYKSAGIFGYNGFTNTVLGASITLTITRTGTLYNETMTITNNSSATVNEWVISLRVWGYSARNNVNTGGQDMVTSSYLVRQN